MRRPLAALLVAGLLVLAGCAGSLPGSGPTLDDVAYPTGVSDDGVNATALTAAHASAVENRSVTVGLDLDQRTPAGNNSVQLEAAVGPDRDRMNVTANASDRTVEMYLTADEEYRRTTANGSASYAVRERTPEMMSLPMPSPSGGRWIAQFAGQANYTPDDVVVEDGTTLVVLTADETSLGESSSTNVTSFDSRLYVSPDGVVHRLAFDYEAEGPNGQSVAMSATFRVSDVGDTTVSEPGWLDDAKAAANETR